MDRSQVSQKFHLYLLYSTFHLVTTKARQEYQNVRFVIKKKTSTLFLTSFDQKSGCKV